MAAQNVNLTNAYILIKENLMNYFRAELCGVVGNVDIFESQGKVPCAKLSVVVSKRLKGQEDAVIEKAIWHNLICFGKQVAMIKENIKKGTRIFAIGELEYSEWTTSTNERRKSAVIKVRYLHPLQKVELPQAKVSNANLQQQGAQPYGS